MAAGKTIEITDESFESEVLGSDIPVLVDYWAPWCGPCRMAAPVLEKIADEYEGRLKVCKVNIDDNRQIAMQYHIMSIPTMLLFKDGERVDQITGVTPNFESDLKRKIEPYVE
ncbi:MAG TPA: thioredoxin [Sedimentisphaerales bacterium]|nr:thioredoxin [Phycisphaerae bacterium]HON92655.1 thioredoxin [Sedimentisphaerales bacterium]HOV78273.1 thioredoxin [Sedimentisphaerales bacterium]HQI26549.1 thioredoxin [Sedimentisphaerales bacterium]